MSDLFARCSARLFQAEKFPGGIFDPACGRGNIVVSARLNMVCAEGFDIQDRGALSTGARPLDFLNTEDWPRRVTFFGRVKNIVCNPPFKLADKFVVRALELATHKVAMLLPATWHFGSKRAKWLETTPLARIYALTPRPSMPPGAVVLAGGKPGGGTKDFAWYVWHQGHKGPATQHYLHRDRAPATSEILGEVAA